VGDPSQTLLEPPEQPPPARSSGPSEGGTRPEASEYCLVDQDRVYPLRVGINTVGRSSDNDVVVPDAHVSRRHCALLVHCRSACELFDTASKNGTFLNGNRLSGPQPLRSGDEIRLNNHQFVFLSQRDLPAVRRTQSGGLPILPSNTLPG
jgi:pSer/pThr/pTyr-binding forkhead associated (FHA) protein